MWHTRVHTYMTDLKCRIACVCSVQCTKQYVWCAMYNTVCIVHVMRTVHTYMHLCIHNTCSNKCTSSPPSVFVGLNTCAYIQCMSCHVTLSATVDTVCNARHSPLLLLTASSSIPSPSDSSHWWCLSMPTQVTTSPFLL